MLMKLILLFSPGVKPAKKSLLTLSEVDQFLEKLSQLTKEEDQLYHFSQIAEKCTSNDLKMIIRLVKHDLRINAGPKHILEGIHPEAYQAFQTTRDIRSVVTRVVPTMSQSGAQTTLAIGVKTLTPVLPMLAEACKSVEQAMRKCPNGMYAEIKYDGERVQVHKQGNEFKFFSRSLKPVLPHKVSHFKDYIPQAFPYGQDLILDSEILMIDVNTGQPLPFGSLGVHKKTQFKDANVCLFVFDCIYYNGESLVKKPMKERRRILEENMKEIKNHVVFSEQKEIHNPKELEAKMTEVFRLGLEGLVLKDLMLLLQCRLYLVNRGIALSFHGPLQFLGTRKKPQGARSGEYGGCGIISVLFLAKKSCTSSDV
ncbi:DNA ligase 3 [Homalodisca vitripennis]|nr:DNA ligase 3 [Homalodisca vitripennis]